MEFSLRVEGFGQKLNAMLRISVSSLRKFDVACDIETVERHWCDFDRILEDLPALKVINNWGPQQFRIAYSSNLAGGYQVVLFSDVEARLDKANHMLVVSPLYGRPAISAGATQRSLTGQGTYASRLVLKDQADHTTVVYEVSITADIPKPLSLSLVPNLLATNAVQAIVRYRLEKMNDLFISRTVSRLAHRRRGNSEKP